MRSGECRRAEQSVGPAAIKHLQGSSWHGAAIAYLGVSLEVVPLPQDVLVGIVAAQKRQYR